MRQGITSTTPPSPAWPGARRLLVFGTCYGIVWSFTDPALALLGLPGSVGTWGLWAYISIFIIAIILTILSENTDRNHYPILYPIFAVIVGIIVGILIGPNLFLSASANKSASGIVVVSASDYPFIPTKTYVDEGDLVEITFLGNDKTWSCHGGGEPLSPAGTKEYPQYQQSLLSPSSNLCMLIGHIEGGPFFPIGTAPRFVATNTGLLYLGANDAPPENCGLSDRQQCFLDNRGKLTVKITVAKKK